MAGTTFYFSVEPQCQDYRLAYKMGGCPKKKKKKEKCAESEIEARKNRGGPLGQKPVKGPKPAGLSILPPTKEHR